MEHVGSSSEDRSTPIPHQFKTSKPHETKAFEGGENTENTTNEQILRPVIPRAGAMEVTNKILGNSLNGLGYGAGIALAPITVPLGFLGAGFGYMIGKGMEKLMDAPPENAAKTGVKIGGSLPYLVTGALVSWGDSLIGKAKEMKQERKGIVRNDDFTSAPDFNSAPDEKGVKREILDIRRFYQSKNFQEDAYGHLEIPTTQNMKNFSRVYMALNKEIVLNNKLIEHHEKLKNANIMNFDYEEHISIERNLINELQECQKLTNEAYLQAIVKDRDNSGKVEVPRQQQDVELVINKAGERAVPEDVEGDVNVSGEAGEPDLEASEASAEDLNRSGEDIDIPITPFNMASDQYGVREKLDEAREAYKNGKLSAELKSEDFPKNFSEVVRFLNSEIRALNDYISFPNSPDKQKDIAFKENRTNEAYLEAFNRDKPVSQKKLDEMTDRHASIMNQVSDIRENIANRRRQEPAATEEFLNLISNPSHPFKNFKEFYKSLNEEIRLTNKAIDFSASNPTFVEPFLKKAKETATDTDAAYQKAIKQDKKL